MASEVGRARHSRRTGCSSRAAPARQDVPGRPRAGPDRRRRGAQARRSPPQQPYGKWLRDHMVPLRDAAGAAASARARPRHPAPAAAGLRLHHRGPAHTPRAHGHGGEEAIGSMGTDTPLAVLSDRPQPLFNYFKQLFAQVTNPPLDAIREELVTSIATSIGPEGNLLEPTPEACRQIKLKTPILDNDELAKIRYMDLPALQVRHPAHALQVSGGPGALAQAMEDALPAVERGGRRRANLLILSDRGVDREHAPIPSLLATAGLHHHLVREGKRVKVGLVIETGEPREVHHFALLLGYGAGTINPYVAFETLDDMIRQGMLPDHRPQGGGQELPQGDQQGRGQGHVQDGHQHHPELPRRPDLRGHRPRARPSSTATSQDGLAHRRRRPRRDRPGSPRAPPPRLPRAAGGRARARLGRPVPVAARRRVPPVQPRDRLPAPARHALRPLRRSSRSTRISSTSRTSGSAPCAGSSTFKPAAQPVPIEEVEPVESIVKRFATGAMSYGSIGPRRTRRWPSP